MQHAINLDQIDDIELDLPFVQCLAGNVVIGWWGEGTLCRQTGIWLVVLVTRKVALRQMLSDIIATLQQSEGYRKRVREEGGGLHASCDTFPSCL